MAYDAMYAGKTREEITKQIVREWTWETCASCGGRWDNRLMQFVDDIYHDSHPLAQFAGKFLCDCHPAFSYGWE